MTQTIFLILTFLLLQTSCWSLKVHLAERWLEFKKYHKKVYTTAMEDNNRRQIWEDNVAHIQKHNLEFDLGKHNYFLGMNEFGDLRHDEFVKRMNGFRTPNYTKERDLFEAPSDFKAPPSVDWRQHGYVTRIKNQLHCGGCWAFATTGSLEGQHFKATKKLVSLSEQQLIDCDKNSDGCSGGDMDPGFVFVKHNGGIASEADYPYRGNDGTCRKISQAVATCSGYIVSKIEIVGR